jgi:hypothetical protein
MDIRLNWKCWDEAMHRWGHNVAVQYNRLVHEEAFWITLIMGLIIAAMVALIAFAPNSPSPGSAFPVPWTPMY